MKTLSIDYKSFSLHQLDQIPQIAQLSSEDRMAIEVVGSVLPFKANQYVTEELIDWSDVPNDPIYTLTFPRREMLIPRHYDEIEGLIRQGADKKAITAAANRIRMELNPHPAGQAHNLPSINGITLGGVQHKYRETLLFFPSQGQTCHAYCTFCFRWPQFVGISELKFAMRETDLLVQYLYAHPEVTDILFTGGDPMIMKTRVLAAYIEPLLADDLEHIQTIRIGTKALGYWPQKFVTDEDADDTLRLFERITARGKNLAIMAHFNHPRELSTPIVQEAVRRIRATGAQIRSQSPVLRHINDHPDTWAEMWRTQVNHNIIPYYMFVERDTGAQHFFALPLVTAWEIFREAYQQVSGVCRTVRGPSMSATPGKIQILGVSEVMGQKVFVMRFLQGRNPDWVAKPFFAAYDAEATWLHDLKPAFGESSFFYESALEHLLHKTPDADIPSFE
ncbi:MAG: lysine 2,3-aminomutase [Bacteroidia bacterium]|nr:lysine 2,3-aminomutase [Bacteroidia bacterium]